MIQNQYQEYSQQTDSINCIVQRQKKPSRETTKPQLISKKGVPSLGMYPHELIFASLTLFIPARYSEERLVGNYKVVRYYAAVDQEFLWRKLYKFLPT